MCDVFARCSLPPLEICAWHVFFALGKPAIFLWHCKILPHHRHCFLFIFDLKTNYTWSCACPGLCCPLLTVFRSALLEYRRLAVGDTYQRFSHGQQIWNYRPHLSAVSQMTDGSKKCPYRSIQIACRCINASLILRGFDSAPLLFCVAFRNVK